MRYKPFFYSYPTQYFFGKDSVYRMEALVEEYQIKNVLIITGKRTSEQLGIDAILKKIFENKGIIYFFEKGFQSNPCDQDVDKVINIISEKDINYIIAVGGGSIIDLAKGSIYYSKKRIGLGTILTIPSSGSESNRSFVIYNNELKKKIAIADKTVIPQFAICDASYMKTLSRRQLMSCCADIMGHLLEQFFCKEDDNFIDMLLLACIDYMSRLVKELERDLHDFDVNQDLMLISSYALSYMLSSGRTMDWLVHEFEHTASEHNQYSHGEGIAVLMPKWIRFSASNEAYQKKLRLMSSYFGLENEEQAVQYIERYFLELGLISNFNEVFDNALSLIEMEKKLFSKSDYIGKVNIINRKEFGEFIDLCKS